MRLIEISKTTPGELPYSVNTLYKWHSKGTNPHLVYKVGGKVFFDLDEWEQMVIASKQSA